ncbi:hypothetical protein QFC22_001221 [Naganishia vaughanmartiniae]|uniref:Uncharacterized protein n=1 Tax=Naganishia vaughanmartiniae TaxID=1424756 RepID=A0ACC2XJX3_9TREE|nr:hypothetical protein QFC22_001221 [Naganishia vaughanmartiniae]
MSPIATTTTDQIMETVSSLPAKLSSALHMAADTLTTPTGTGTASHATSTLRLPHFSAPLPAHKPYVLESDEGETITLVGSGSVMRYLATAKETGDQYAIIHTRARPDEPVPAHFHARTHDTFLCLRGTMKVWENDQCRILGPGDFASVPPKCVHAFQPLSPENEFIGIISPGSWTKMFNFIGEPYTTSPTFPWNDSRPFPVPLFIEAIKAGEDVIPQREYSYPSATEMSESENVVPQDSTPYFLKADCGPKYFIASQSCSPLTLARNTNNAFALSIIAGIGSQESFPSFPKARTEKEAGPFPAGKQIKLASHSLFRVIEGRVKFTVGATEEVVTAGESVMVPAGTGFNYLITSAYARIYAFSGKGGGLEEVFVRLGREGVKGEVVGENEDAAVSEENVEGVLKALGGEVV